MNQEISLSLLSTRTRGNKNKNLLPVQGRTPPLCWTQQLWGWMLASHPDPEHWKVLARENSSPDISMPQRGLWSTTWNRIDYF